ncbi:sterol desaturase family protein [Candidatus Poriferisodalis sp.]|uniref:sterol desaturase family protein n=1 Tax=Candidatus Poriferisodalis sp. TaxID=3101277 RepID=UPI003B0164EC
MGGIDWSLLIACIGGASLVGIAAYHAVAGCFYCRYYIRRRAAADSWKLQPERFLSPELHRLAVWTGTRNMALSGLLSGALVYAILSGSLDTPIYTDVAGWGGWSYTIGSTLVLFVLTDYIAYLVHRTLHTRFLFKHVHRFHHRFVATNPYVTFALHPAELLLMQAATLAPLLIIPFHAVSVVGVLLYIVVFNIAGHSGVRLESALPWQPPARFHDDHHAHVHVNFGQHLLVWDRLHGTMRRQGRHYGPEVFGGRGERDRSEAGAGRQLEPFVRY